MLPDPQLSPEAKIRAAVDALNAAGPYLLIVDNLESVQAGDRTLSDAGLLRLLQTLLDETKRAAIAVQARSGFSSPSVTQPRSIPSRGHERWHLSNGRYAPDLLCSAMEWVESAKLNWPAWLHSLPRLSVGMRRHISPLVRPGVRHEIVRRKKLVPYLRAAAKEARCPEEGRIDRGELSEAIIHELSALFEVEVRAAGPALLAADLDEMERRMQQLSRRVCGALLERVAAVRARGRPARPAGACCGWSSGRGGGARRV